MTVRARVFACVTDVNEPVRREDGATAWTSRPRGVAVPRAARRFPPKKAKSARQQKVCERRDDATNCEQKKTARNLVSARASLREARRRALQANRSRAMGGARNGGKKVGGGGLGSVRPPPPPPASSFARLRAAVAAPPARSETGRSLDAVAANPRGCRLPEKRAHRVSSRPPPPRTLNPSPPRRASRDARRGTARTSAETTGGTSSRDTRTATATPPWRTRTAPGWEARDARDRT